MADRIHVLVVDDDPRILKTARRYLSDCDVLCASSGNEAISLLRSNRVDVIVSDYNMANGNGLDFKKAVNLLNKNIPFILMSGQVTKELSVKMANLHVFWIVEKPVIFDELLHKIEEAYLDFENHKKNEKLSIIGKSTGQIIHDLNNSLSIIQMSSEMGKELSTEDFAKRQFDRTLGSCKRIQKMIEKYRDFSNNKESIKFEDYNLHSLLKEFEEEFNDTYSNQNKISLSLENQLSPDLLVKIDSDLIYQVLLNLMKNSVDAISLFPSPWIKLVVSESEDKVFVRFKDSGKGIPAEILGQVFDENLSTKGSQGTGMGLSYCRKIMNFHLGEIWVDSRDTNTTFVLEFVK